MNSSISKKGVVNELIIGFFILLFGIVWLMHQAGLVQETAWIWPFGFIYFGTLIVVGAIYRMKH